MSDADFADPANASFAYGFADAFAAELYGGLNVTGATVLATPYSRLFVDVNRRRDDFTVDDKGISSKRGVVRTHTVRDRPIFARPLSSAYVEEILADFYDPYHRKLDDLVAEQVGQHGYALILDLHTGSPRGLGDCDVVLGTGRGTTADPRLVDCVAERFSVHGFEPHRDLKGYSGGHITRRFGKSRSGRVQAIQIEVNASLLVASSYREFIDGLKKGEEPRGHEKNIGRVRTCLHEVIPEISARLDALNTEGGEDSLSR